MEPTPSVTTLADTTWPQVPQGSVLVIPIGSTEQHGHHLPLSTDTIIAEHLARALCADDRFVLGPTIPVGASGEHQSFPGTLSIGHDALQLVLIELIRSATPQSFRSVVLVNGHGGNEASMRRVVDHQRNEGRTVIAWSPSLPDGGDHHAGHTETSVMLHIAPRLVGDRRTAGPALTQDIVRSLIEVGVGGVSPSGVIGNPDGASAESGGLIFAAWVEHLRAAAEAAL
jgi:mycofactocin precursor peptide peptidase